MMTTQAQTEALLEELEHIHKRQWQERPTDLTRRKEIIQQLVEVGEYPEKPTNGTVLGMVVCYGAYWHRWTGVLECPQCHFDLRDLHAGTPFRLGVLVKHRMRWQIDEKCPQCHHRWPFNYEEDAPEGSLVDAQVDVPVDAQEDEPAVA